MRYYTNGDWDFSYVVVNNRVAGQVYDADGRSTWADSTNFTYDASGRMVSTSRYTRYSTQIEHDGLAREVKRTQRVWDAEEEELGEAKTTYLIFSSVLGRIVTEAFETGKKRRTFVVAAGSVIARQAVTEDDVTEVVGMEYRDASGFSTRSGTAGTASITGTNAYNTEELDGLGNNVGRLGDLSRPPHEGGPTQSPEDSPTIDDMTMGDCTLDGIPVPCSMAFRSLRSGSALPEHLAKQYQHDPAFAFTPTGSGAFTVTLPKQVGWHVNPDGSIDRIYSQYSGTSHISTYTSGVNITNIPVPPEMTDCEKFLSELLTGEDDAIFSDVTDDDPIDTLTGMNEAPENSVATDDQRLQTHNHLYNPVSNPTRGTRILAPVGGQIIGSGRTNNGNQAFVNVFYKELGGEKNIVLQFFHTFHGEKFEGETMQADGTMSVGKMGSDGSWPIGYGKGENGRPVVGFHVHINAWYWWGKTDRNGDPILKRAGLHPEGKNRTLKRMFKLSNLCPE